MHTHDSLTLLQPRRLNFGCGCIGKMVEDLKASGVKNLLILTVQPVLLQLENLFERIRKEGIQLTVDTTIEKEPDRADYHRILEIAKRVGPDAVAGIGGGSVMDVAKLIAAGVTGSQTLDEIFGIGKLTQRDLLLICVPTTSGTGSEVSPNAILLDENDGQKKGIISPHLMPDLVYADPELTFSLPPSVTAATGIDALTHCIEAYANRFAHPMVDLYAREGIRLISRNIVKVCKSGDDPEGRSAVMLGSLYGGICLGPVNTAAVHALSYPLGSKFRIAHGISNALLLPHVLEFNLPGAMHRYADIAEAMGCESGGSTEETAKSGLRRIKSLMEECEIPLTMSELGISRAAVEEMAADAMKVTRLLKNNVREVRYEDAVKIYEAAF